MVLNGSDPRIAPADLRQADLESDAVQRRNTRRRLESLEAYIADLEKRLAWAERDLKEALAANQTTTLDGVRAEYIVNGERH